jgi:hypothetical protein
VRDVDASSLIAPATISRTAEPAARPVERRTAVSQASTRKYKKKSSFSREFNKSMKSLQRSLDKLF